MSPTALAPAFFLAVAVILVVCRLVGWALRALGQPPVVGEMVAGVVLGPSVLGLIAPGVESAIFPQALRPVLYVVGQIGLVVFMFQAGYEFRTDRVRRVARSVVTISTAGIVAPLLLGAGLTWVAHDVVHIFPADVSLLVSALFVGVTLAITAFPMLARIITERGLTDSRFGSIALASGAVDDAVAWVLLAGVLSIAAGSAGPVALAVGGTAVLVIVLMLISRAGGQAGNIIRRIAPEHLLLVLVVVLFLAAWYTDRIGLYAVFGAFSLGVVPAFRVRGPGRGDDQPGRHGVLAAVFHLLRTEHRLRVAVPSGAAAVRRRLRTRRGGRQVRRLLARRAGRGRATGGGAAGGHPDERPRTDATDRDQRRARGGHS